MSDQSDALVQWIAAQQRASSISQKQPAPELHLHQHHHPTTAAAAEFERRPERLHPLFVAVYMLFVSIAISVPLALLAAIVDASNRPDVQYIQPQRGGW
jgi:hypothetical protein